jgi:hypothetical protein
MHTPSNSSTAFTSAKEEILALAKKHGISYHQTALDELADNISRLSDAEVEFDEIENLLVAIGRANLINGKDRILLHHKYLMEKECSKK